LVYPPDKYRFSQEHEKDMWVYFIENQLLFKTDQDLQRRFIEVAPFSKFRTKTDPETPGRIGRWFGYRIIDAYLEEYPNLDLKALINEKDARKILKLSAYKP
ncbi:MAG: gliding motility protein, GldB, partial [Croceimicrobium sp.]